MGRTDLLDAALRYAEMNWPVFPLAPRSKLPLIPALNGGRGLHDATTDAATIRAWWQAHPTANIGLRTGVAFDVVDLDGPPAAKALAQARQGRERLHGPMVWTARGYHVFIQPTGLGNRAGVLPGVDFRGKDGYVVAPPSVHPDGHRHQWITPFLGDLADVPAWLLQRLAPERPSPSNHVSVDPARATAYGRAALRRELESGPPRRAGLHRRAGRGRMSRCAPPIRRTYADLGLDAVMAQ